MQKMTLKTLRSTKNWNQNQASKAVNVAKETWGNWERGITTPSISKAYEIAKVFDVSIDDIYFFENNCGLTAERR